MKRLVPLSLTLLFLFNLVGYYIAFPVVAWCYKSTVRAGMEAGIFKKELVLVKIPVSLTNTPNEEFQMTDADEFQYKGKMYDVSCREVKGDMIYFYCYADCDEDHLMAGLYDHVEADSALNAQEHKTKSHKTVSSLIKEYLKPLNYRLNIAPSMEFTRAHFLSARDLFVVPDIRIPPPKQTV